MAVFDDLEFRMNPSTLAGRCVGEITSKAITTRAARPDKV